MSPWAYALLMLACLHVTTAAPNTQTSNLRVEFGTSAILPCNGSAYQGEEGTIHWETSLGQDVATLRVLRTGNYETITENPRFQLPSEDQLSSGNWSLVLPVAMQMDSGTYQCIWEGQTQTILSTVWVTVNDPHFEDNVVTYEGEAVMLKCFLQLPWSQNHSTLQAGWKKDGQTVVEMENQLITIYKEHFTKPFGSMETFHLLISPTQMDDNGEYRCWYKTGSLESPRPGLPDRIKLTVLEKHHEEKEAQIMEALQETATSYPEEETKFKPSERENLPWVLIGLITGVLLVTAFTLCILKAKHKI